MALESNRYMEIENFFETFNFDFDINNLPDDLIKITKELLISGKFSIEKLEMITKSSEDQTSTMEMFAEKEGVEFCYYILLKIFRKNSILLENILLRTYELSETQIKKIMNIFSSYKGTTGMLLTIMFQNDKKKGTLLIDDPKILNILENYKKFSVKNSYDALINYWGEQTSVANILEIVARLTLFQKTYLHDFIKNDIKFKEMYDIFLKEGIKNTRNMENMTNYVILSIESHMKNNCFMNKAIDIFNEGQKEKLGIYVKSVQEIDINKRSSAGVADAFSLIDDIYHILSVTMKNFVTDHQENILKDILALHNTILSNNPPFKDYKYDFVFSPYVDERRKESGKRVIKKLDRFFEDILSKETITKKERNTLLKTLSNIQIINLISSLSDDDYNIAKGKITIGCHTSNGIFNISMNENKKEQFNLCLKDIIETVQIIEKICDKHSNVKEQKYIGELFSTIIFNIPIIGIMDKNLNQGRNLKKINLMSDKMKMLESKLMLSDRARKILKITEHINKGGDVAKSYFYEPNQYFEKRKNFLKNGKIKKENCENVYLDKNDDEKPLSETTKYQYKNKIANGAKTNNKSMSIIIIDEISRQTSSLESLQDEFCLKMIESVNDIFKGNSIKKENLYKYNKTEHANSVLGSTTNLYNCALLTNDDDEKYFPTYFLEKLANSFSLYQGVFINETKIGTRLDEDYKELVKKKHEKKQRQFLTITKKIENLKKDFQKAFETGEDWRNFLLIKLNEIENLWMNCDLEINQGDFEKIKNCIAENIKNIIFKENNNEIESNNDFYFRNVFKNEITPHTQYKTTETLESMLKEKNISENNAISIIKNFLDKKTVFFSDKNLNTTNTINDLVSFNINFSQIIELFKTEKFGYHSNSWQIRLDIHVRKLTENQTFFNFLTRDNYFNFYLNDENLKKLFEAGIISNIPKEPIHFLNNNSDQIKLMEEIYVFNEKICEFMKKADRKTFCQMFEKNVSNFYWFVFWDKNTEFYKNTRHIFDEKETISSALEHMFENNVYLTWKDINEKIYQNKLTDEQKNVFITLVQQTENNLETFKIGQDNKNMISKGLNELFSNSFNAHSVLNRNQNSLETFNGIMKNIFDIQQKMTVEKTWEEYEKEINNIKNIDNINIFPYKGLVIEKLKEEYNKKFEQNTELKI